ncbi:MAG: SpoIID/LytB domain-containing protein [Bacteroidales bacterium]
MMYLQKYCLVICLCFFSYSGIAQEISVALFYQQETDGFKITTQKDNYKIVAGDSTCAVLPANTNISVSAHNGQVALTSDSIEFTAGEILLIADSTESGFFINLPGEDAGARAYTGNLKFYDDSGILRAINLVPLEAYVAATAEAEGGYNAHQEYYKTQAVIARTYALRNLHRHEAEGFQLCDKTHCQVYPGKATDPDIIEAAGQTRGEVIVDSAFTLINAVYHSNSGGVTANARDVWTSHLDYLVSVEDTFSLGGKHATWQRDISLAEWRIFLTNQGVDIRNTDDSLLIKKIEERSPVIQFNRVSIPMRKIRSYFDLKSAYFDMDIESNKLIFRGKGYGHGVGLSQEGAMAMAVLQYDYEDIISHYYSGSMVVHLRLLDVFEGLERLGGE